MTNRLTSAESFMLIAMSQAYRGTCLRRNYGSVIVKNNKVISTGYTGSPCRCTNCIDTGVCLREKLHILSGQRYELCKSVHSEMNAIINGDKQELIGSTLYLYGIDHNSHTPIDSFPCMMCKKMIINAGIENVICNMSDSSHKVLNVIDFIDDINNIGEDYNK